MVRSVMQEQGGRGRRERRDREEDNLPPGSNIACKTCMPRARTEEAGHWTSTYKQQGINDINMTVCVAHRAVSKNVGKSRGQHGKPMAADVLSKTTTRRRAPLAGWVGRTAATKIPVRARHGIVPVEEAEPTTSPQPLLHLFLHPRRHN